MKRVLLLLLQFDSPTQIHSLKHKGTHTLPAPDVNTHTHTHIHTYIHVQTLLCTKWPPPFSRHTFEESRNNIFVVVGRFVESTNIEFVIARDNKFRAFTVFKRSACVWIIWWCISSMNSIILFLEYVKAGFNHV